MNPSSNGNDLESSNVRNNNEYFTHNLYNESETLTDQETLRENLLEKSKADTPREDPTKEQEPLKQSEADSEDASSGSSDNQDNMDFNLKTTIAHLQSDLVYSIGVFISAVLINFFPDKLYFDSICTILFSYVAMELTIPIFKESMRILLEGSAEGGRLGRAKADRLEHRGDPAQNQLHKRSDRRAQVPRLEHLDGGARADDARGVFVQT